MRHFLPAALMQLNVLCCCYFWGDEGKKITGLDHLKLWINDLSLKGTH